MAYAPKPITKFSKEIHPALSALGAVLLAGLCSLAILGPYQSAWAKDVAVVVHPEVEEEGLTLVQVRRMLLGNRQFWSQSQRVTLLVPASSIPEREVLLRVIYEMTDAQYRHYWIAKVFRAESTVAPKLFYSDEVAFKLIRGIPGAVALVDADQVPQDLKVIKVNGYLPGEQGYPLR